MPTLPLIIVVVAIIGAGAAWLVASPGNPVAQNEVARTPETETTPEPPKTDKRNNERDKTTPETDAATDESDAQPASDITDTTDDATSTERYTATAQYLTPAREPHTVQVTLTLQEDNTVDEVDVLYDGDKSFANKHQENFEAEITGTVTGVTLNNVTADRVGGASLTSSAFNDAVDDIRDQVSTS
jgi:cytoskeletal protein RodZ